MIDVSSEIFTQFDAQLVNMALPETVRPQYRKWLRFDLDF